METSFEWRGCKTLKCSICSEYFNRPHTLKCGHTFCISCLTRLRRTAPSKKSRTNISRFKVLCPTCGYPVPMRAISKRKLGVTYSLQDIVDFWLLQQNQDRDRSVVSLRSVGSQSGDENEEDDLISRESFSQLPSRYYACQLSNNESQNTTQQLVQRKSSSSTSLEQLVVPYQNQDRHVVSRFTDIFRGICVEFREFVADVIRCPNRSLMALVWSGYTFSIMMISAAFLPYMILYSVLFVLILYAESAQHRQQNRHLRE